MDTNYSRQQRNRNKNKYRLLEGLKKVILPPFLGAIPVILLTLLLLFGLSNRGLVFNINSSGLFYQVSDYIKIAALLTIYAAFVYALLTVIGTPRKWKAAENAVMRVFDLEFTPEEIPILISSKRMRNGTHQWIFLSASVPFRLWQDKDNIDDICQRLGCHVVGQVERGGRNKNDCHIVVFYTKPGAKSLRSGELQDDEF